MDKSTFRSETGPNLAPSCHTGQFTLAWNCSSREIGCSFLAFGGHLCIYVTTHRCTQKNIIAGRNEAHMFCLF